MWCKIRINNMEHNKDLPNYDFGTPEDSLEQFESSLSKAAKNQKIPAKTAEKLDKALKKLSLDVQPPTPTSSMKSRYEKAWTKIYGEQKDWRKKEIDNFIKAGIFGDNRWDTDFVKQVMELAESDKPL